MKDNPLFQLIKQFHGKISSTIYTPLSEKLNPQHLAFLRNLEKSLDTEKCLYIPFDELNVVLFDFETTGFFPERGDQILSIGAVKFKNGEMKPEETFYTLVQYDKSLSSEIKRLTGLDEFELKDAPALSESLIRFYQFVGSVPLVAHHASHEKKFLQHAHWKAFKKPFYHRIIDTSLLFNIVTLEKDIVSLEDYCLFSGVEIRNRHHALGDALILAELWKYYITKLKCKGINTLTDVYERIATQTF